MRACIPFLWLTLVAGCASYSPEPGKVPDDALASMFTATPAGQVAACIARTVGSEAQISGDTYVITSRTGTSYTIAPNRSDSAYPVQVIIRGAAIVESESERTALCLHDGTQTT